MKLRIAILALLLAPSVSFGATVYETAAPLSEQVIDFPVTGSGTSSTPVYSFWYELPAGISYDRIQMSVPSSVTSYSKTIYTSLGTVTSGNKPWNCMNDNCVNGAYSAVSTDSSSNDSNPTSGTIQWLMSTTTTVTTGTIFNLSFDPNPAYVDFSYNGTPNQPYAAGTNGSAYTKTLIVPTIKFCNGNCDSDDFSPIPNLSSSPWVRVTSPLSGSNQTGSITFTVQANTGTSSADNVQIRFASNFQSISPYDYNITATGLSQFTFTVNVPDIADTFQVIADLRVSTSSVVTSPVYRYFITTEENPGGVTSEEVTSCDDESGLTWAICKVFNLLLVPSQASVDKFMSINSTLETKFPFVYVYQFSDSIDDLYTASSTATSTISYDFAGLGTLTLLSVDQLEAVPFQGWLRTILGYLMWIMFAVLVYTRTLRIFNTDPQ